MSDIVDIEKDDEQEAKVIEEELEDYTDEEMNQLLSEAVKSASPLVEYMSSLPKQKVVSPEKERELLLAAHNGDQNAINFLVENNLKLVVFFANRVSFTTSVPLMDLIQEGNIGLIKAAQGYDPEQNVKFSTYAGVCAVRAMQRCIYANERLIKLPVHKALRLRKAKAIMSRVMSEHAGEIRADSEEMREILQKELKCSSQEVVDIMKLINLEPISLSTPLHGDDGDDSGSELQDYVAVDEETVYTKVEREMLKEAIDDFLNTFKPRDKEVICRRFGLNGYEPQTLNEVGLAMGITRERVRQIESRVLKSPLSRTRLRRDYGLDEF